MKKSQYQKSKIQKSDDPDFQVDNCFNEKDEFYTIEKGVDYYFDSYSHFSIHEEMLKDKIRTNAYRDAILDNAHLFKDKIVLDVGCGTGILSIFAAKAGAKHVYGVELASIAEHTKVIIKNNHFEDKITIFRSKLEDTVLPVDKVDIIISEWMGYFLVYESMFDTVIYARDKWLAPDGLLFPDKAKMYVAGIEDEKYKKRKIEFWDKVYGVDMSCMKKWAAMEPQVDGFEKEGIVSDYSCFQDFDLQTAKKEDMDFSNKYKFKIRESGDLTGLVAWFDCYFTHGEKQVLLSTSPYLGQTHWKQTIFYFNKSFYVHQGDVLSGQICVKKNQKNPREIDVKISACHNNDQRSNQVSIYRI